MDIPEAVRQAQLVMDCVDQLEPEDRLVLDIWLDDNNEKIMRICEALEVSDATAYRRKDRVLGVLSKLFVEIGVRIS